MFFQHRARFRILITVLALIIASAGCGNFGGDTNKNQNAMVKANGKFQKGYQDGMRDGQYAWGNTKGANLWLWAQDHQYKQGYDRGWKDGRQMAKLKEYQGKQLGTREPLTPTPTLKQGERMQPSTPLQPSKPSAKPSQPIQPSKSLESRATKAQKAGE